MAKGSDCALDLSFFPAARGIAGMRVEGVFAREGEESWNETDEAAIMFDDGGCEIIIGDLACNASQRSERMDVAAGEGLEALAVSELDVQHPAMGIDERKRV